MPKAALRPCRYAGCPNLVEHGGYCHEHRHVKNIPRMSAARRGYDANWRRLRLMILADRPLCADPFGIHAADGYPAIAEEVDHITPLSKGGTNHVDNLQPLCKSCHSRKTMMIDVRRDERPEGRAVEISTTYGHETGAAVKKSRPQNGS